MDQEERLDLVIKDTAGKSLKLAGLRLRRANKND
jgi:hypothetical protein